MKRTKRYFGWVCAWLFVVFTVSLVASYVAKAAVEPSIDPAAAKAITKLWNTTEASHQQGSTIKGVLCLYIPKAVNKTPASYYDCIMKFYGTPVKGVTPPVEYVEILFLTKATTSLKATVLNATKITKKVYNKDLAESKTTSLPTA